VNEVVTQQVPVQVQRIETEEVVRDVPVQVQRPVTERIVNKVPVQTLRWEEQEQVRQVPYTVQRIEYDEQVEQIPVRTCRYVSETNAVQVPRHVGKWVAYTSMRLQPRIVTMRVPLVPAVETVIAGPPAYVAPAAPAAPPPVRLQRPLGNGTNGAAKKNGESVLKPKQDGKAAPAQAPTPAAPQNEGSDKSGEAKDTDETGRPDLKAPGNARQTSTDRRA